MISQSTDTDRLAPTWWPVTLPVLGLVSGLLTVRYLAIAIAFPIPVPIFQAIFGALVWLGLREFYDRPNRWKAAAFAGASAVAGVLSQFLGFFSIHVTLGALPTSNAIAFFPAGFVGAFVLFSTALSLLPKMTARLACARALPWAVAGGLLGVIGWALGPSLGRFLWFTLNRWHVTHSLQSFEHAQIDFEPQCYSLYLVWQVAVAFLLGVACRYQARRPLPRAALAPQSTTTVKSSGIFFYVGMVLLVLFVALVIVGMIDRTIAH